MELKLPTVRGSNLQRQKMEFPADFTGDLNLVFVAFQQWQQRQVDSWVPLAEDLAQEYHGLDYYEFPTIQPMNIFSRTFINEGMRTGIRNSATRARTITLYLDKAAFRQALAIADEDDISVFLFDRNGHVLWRATGPYSPEKEADLRTALAAAREATY